MVLLCCIVLYVLYYTVSSAFACTSQRILSLSVSVVTVVTRTRLTFTRVLYKANGLAVYEKTASGRGIRFLTLQTVIYDMYTFKL